MMSSSTNNKFSFSRIDCYNRCPRKHYYQYIEKIPTEGNKSLIAGGLFHKGVEKLSTDGDIKEVIDKYKQFVLSGSLDTPEDLMQNILTRYYGHYKNEQEKILAVEWKFSDDLGNGDMYSGVIDKIIELDDGTVKIRDTKTTFSALKTEPDIVRFHQQLMSYVPFVEEAFGVKVSEIEIDEVRLADLDPIPLNANGKPSADKRKLGLVLFEDYYNKLAEMGLDEAPEYQSILDWLDKRGHCLFRRVSIQILDDAIIDSNIKDIYDSYESCRAGKTHRVITPLCEWCGYKDLCRLDYFCPSDDDRGIMIEKVMTTRTK